MQKKEKTIHKKQLIPSTNTLKGQKFHYSQEFLVSIERCKLLHLSLNHILSLPDFQIASSHYEKIRAQIGCDEKKQGVSINASFLLAHCLNKYAKMQEEFDELLANFRIVQVNHQSIYELQTHNLYYFLNPGNILQKKSLSRDRSHRVGRRFGVRKKINDKTMERSESIGEPVQKGFTSLLQHFLSEEPKKTFGVFHANIGDCVILQLYSRECELIFQKIKLYYQRKIKLLMKFQIMREVCYQQLEKNLEAFKLTKIPFNGLIYDNKLRTSDIFFLVVKNYYTQQGAAILQVQNQLNSRNISIQHLLLQASELLINIYVPAFTIIIKVSMNNPFVNLSQRHPETQNQAPNKKDDIRFKIHHINLQLRKICCQRVGDLISNSPHQILKTLNLVQILIEKIRIRDDVQKEIETHLRQLNKQNKQKTEIILNFQEQQRAFHSEKKKLNQKALFYHTHSEELQAQVQKKDKQISRLKEHQQKQVVGVKDIFCNLKDLANSQKDLLNKILIKQNSFEMPEAFKMQEGFPEIIDEDQFRQAMSYFKKQRIFFQCKREILQKQQMDQIIRMQEKQRQNIQRRGQALQKWNELRQLSDI